MQVISHLYCFQIFKEENPAHVMGGNLPGVENGALCFLLGTDVLLGTWILQTCSFCLGQYLGYRTQCLCAQREGKSWFCFAIETHLSSQMGLGPRTWGFFIRLISKLNEMKSIYVFNLYSRGKAILKN